MFHASSTSFELRGPGGTMTPSDAELKHPTSGLKLFLAFTRTVLS